MRKRKTWGFIVECILIALTVTIPVSCEYGPKMNDGSQDAVSRAAAKPFPQHVAYVGTVIQPTNVTQTAMDTTVQNHYNAWKSNYVATLNTNPVQKWIKFSSTETVSEAMGYGMVIAAYMGDKTDYDAMYYYTLAHPCGSGGSHLLAWIQTLQSNGTMQDGTPDYPGDTDSATDGDLDVAYSLLLADAQWGSSGSIDYKSRALLVLHDILTYDVNQTDWILLLGCSASTPQDITRPSDFMMDHFVAFANVDTANTTKWNNIYNKICTMVNYQYNHGSGSTGLVPEYFKKSGSNFVPYPGTYNGVANAGDFYYNACRTPWRLPMSYITSGQTEIQTALTTQNSWIKTKTSSTPTNICAGYYIINGTNGNVFDSDRNLCNVAPFAVEAMLGGSGSQTWLNSLWTSITGGDYGLTNAYYSDAIRMQVLLTVSGNWWLPGSSSATYTITSSAGSNGSISPLGSVVVNSGASQTFTISPNSGYAVNTVTVDGTNQGSITSYTFSNVTATHTISATFVQSSGSNIAPSGTGYVWKNNTSATSNSNRTAQTGINNNNLTTNVDISSGDSANRWEAAGVTFSSSKTITSVKYYAGDLASSGDGYFEANAKLQFSTDGSTWTDSGWTVSPSFSYTSSDCGKTYTFSGTQVTGKKGVRIVGQVRVNDGSYYARVKEVQVYGQ